MITLNINHKLPNGLTINTILTKNIGYNQLDQLFFNNTKIVFDEEIILILSNKKFKTSRLTKTMHKLIEHNCKRIELYSITEAFKLSTADSLNSQVRFHTPYSQVNIMINGLNHGY